MRRSVKSKKVIRAIAVGLSTFLVSASPMAALTANAETDTQEKVDVETEKEKTDSDNQKITDTVVEARTNVEDTIEENLKPEDTEIIEDLEECEEDLTKVEGTIEGLDALNQIASEKKTAYEEAAGEDKQSTLGLAVDAAKEEQKNAQDAAEAAGKEAENAEKAADQVEELADKTYANAQAAVEAKKEAQAAAASAEEALENAKKQQENAQTAVDHAKIESDAAKELVGAAAKAHEEAVAAVSDAQKRLDEILAAYNLQTDTPVVDADGNITVSGDIADAIQAARAALDEATKVQNDTQTALTDAEAKKAEAEQELAAATSANEAAKKALEDALAMKAQAELELQAAQTTKQEKETAVAEAVQKKEAAETAKEEAKEESEKALQALQEANGRYGEAVRDLIIARNKQSIAWNELTNAQTRFKECQTNYSKADAQKKQAKQAYDAAVTQLENAKKSLEKANQTADEDKASAAAAQQAYINAVIALQKAEGELHTKEEAAQAAGLALEQAQAAKNSADQAKTHADMEVSRKETQIEELKKSVSKVDEEGNDLQADPGGNLYQQQLAAQADYELAVKEKEEADKDLTTAQANLKLYEAANDAAAKEAEAESEEEEAGKQFAAVNDETLNELLAKIKAAKEKLDQTTDYVAYYHAGDELTPLLIQYKLYTEQKIDPKDVTWGEFHSKYEDDNYIEITYTDADGNTVVAYYDYVVENRTTEFVSAKELTLEVVEKDKAYTNGSDRLTLGVEDGKPVYLLNGKALADNQKVTVNEDGTYTITTTTKLDVTKSDTGAKIEKHGDIWYVDGVALPADTELVKHKVSVDEVGNVTVTKTTFETVYKNGDTKITKAVTKDEEDRDIVTYYVDGKALAAEDGYAVVEQDGKWIVTHTTKVVSFKNEKGDSIRKDGDKYFVGDEELKNTKDITYNIRHDKDKIVVEKAIQTGAILYTTNIGSPNEKTLKKVGGQYTFSQNDEDYVIDETYGGCGHWYKWIVKEEGKSLKVYKCIWNGLFWERSWCSDASFNKNSGKEEIITTTTTYQKKIDENKKVTEYKETTEKLETEDTVFTKQTQDRSTDKTFCFEFKFAGKGEKTEIGSYEQYENDLQAAKNALDASAKKLADSKEAFEKAKEVYRNATADEYNVDDDKHLQETIDLALKLVENVSSIVKQTQEKRDTADQAIKEAQTNLDDAKTLLEVLKEAAKKAAGTCDNALQNLNAATRESNEANRELDLAKTACETAQRKQDEAKDAWKAAQAELEKQEKVVFELDCKVKYLERRAKELKQNSDTKKKELEEAKKELGAAQFKLFIAQNTLNAMNRLVIENTNKYWKAVGERNLAIERKVAADITYVRASKETENAKAALAGAQKEKAEADKAVTAAENTVASCERDVSLKQTEADTRLAAYNAAVQNADATAEAVKELTDALAVADAKKSAVEAAYKEVVAAAEALKGLKAQEGVSGEAVASMQEAYDLAKKAYEDAVKASEDAKKQVELAKEAVQRAQTAAQKEFKYTEPKKESSSGSGSGSTVIADTPTPLAASVAGAKKTAESTENIALIEAPTGEVLGLQRPFVGEVLGAERPQTGDDTNIGAALFGVVTSGLMLLGYGLKKKKESAAEEC